MGLPALVMAQAPGTTSVPQQALVESRRETTQDYNQRLQQLLHGPNNQIENLSAKDYLLGSDDLLDVSVFEAPDLNRTVRVSANGEISLPLLGDVRAAGLTSPGLGVVLEELLRRSYMKDPHVGVFVREVQSHPVSVFGAVGKPGVYQIRGAKTLIEVLSMAQGLANDAGDTVIVMRQTPTATGHALDEVVKIPAAGSLAEQPPDAKAPDPGTVPEESKATEVSLKELLDSGSSAYNVLVYPGDVVKVTRAGIVYVLGEVKKPGGFILSNNENITVLQALALASGLTRTSAANKSRIIRVDKTTGTRSEIPIHLKEILAGKSPDQVLLSKDVVFIPNSTGKTVLYRGAEAVIGIGSSVVVYRTP
ncbi:MAG: hypothetical protein NVS9B14_02650 [Candidatus Acidiferrum sp.]